MSVAMVNSNCCIHRVGAKVLCLSTEGISDVTGPLVHSKLSMSQVPGFTGGTTRYCDIYAHTCLSFRRYLLRIVVI